MLPNKVHTLEKNFLAVFSTQRITAKRNDIEVRSITSMRFEGVTSISASSYGKRQSAQSH